MMKLSAKYHGILEVYLYFTTTLIAGIVYVINNLFINNTKIQLIVIITFVSLFVLMIVTSKFSPIKILRIRAKLKDVIRHNKLYVRNENSKFISRSLYFKVWKQNHVLFIEAYPDGLDLIHKLERLGKVIETSINLPLLDAMNNKPDCYTYTFSTLRPQRILVNTENFKHTNKAFIQLDSEKKWDFNKYPHGLVSGKTGGGKTYFIFYLILNLLAQEAKVFIADPKMKDLYALRVYLGDENVVTTANQVAKLLRTMYEEIEKRNKTMSKDGIDGFGKDYRQYNFQPIFIFLDEVFDVISENKKTGEEINTMLTKVVSKGRQYGIFVIMATQRPSADTINTNIRDQLSLRVSLGKMYKEGLKMCLGDDFDELPAAEQSQAKGYIYIDGLGWSMPRSFEAPYFEQNEKDLFKEITYKIKNHHL